MNITAGAIVVIVILILVGFCFFFNSKIGKRVRIRASGTANEAIQKDAATPEGAKAYYNAAIEKKEDELQQENVRYQQMLGKISNYEDDLFHYFLSFRFQCHESRCKCKCLCGSRR